MEVNGRPTPAAIIPMDTREEVIEELEATRPPTELRRNACSLIGFCADK